MGITRNSRSQSPATKLSVRNLIWSPTIFAIGLDPADLPTVRSFESSAISTAKLKRLPALHARPIEQVVYLRPYQLMLWGISSWGRLRT